MSSEIRYNVGDVDGDVMTVSLKVSTDDRDRFKCQ
jgi:hypothetical protein